ncbi:MAG: hypothetical protein Q8P85_03000 [Pseudomonas sp.]|jgi:hypothetical protein|nr:hypothetical protein [Pseudomonas sp.]
MFLTFDDARDPASFSALGVNVWRAVEYGPERPWFHVIVRETCDGLTRTPKIFVSELETLVSLIEASSEAFKILDISAVTPDHTTKPATWRMLTLAEVAILEFPSCEVFSYTTECGLKIVESDLDESEQLVSCRVIFSLNQYT